MIYFWDFLIRVLLIQRSSFATRFFIFKQNLVFTYYITKFLVKIYCTHRGDTMDYSDLFQLWKNERSSKLLCKIPKDLYISFDGMLAKLNSEVQTSEKPIIANEILSRILFIRKDFVQIRVSKIVNFVIHGISFDESVLTWGERRIVDSLRRSIETIGVELPNILDTQGVSLEIDQYKNLDKEHDRFHLKSKRKNANLEFLTVRVLDNVESFVGLDNVTYGPLERKDVVYLPLENATALIARGVARLIELPDNKVIGEEL